MIKKVWNVWVYVMAIKYKGYILITAICSAMAFHFEYYSTQWDLTGFYPWNPLD